MPNTLAHLGVQTLATRAILRTADVKWIFLGAMIPDVPWIVGRATKTLLPAFHGYDLWAYLIAQSSLAVSLLLCGAVAVLAPRPWRAFGILSINALLHLVLDGVQEKWGDGVHLFAPVSWRGWNAGWFAIESWPTYLLTLIGLLVGACAVWQGIRAHPRDADRITIKRRYAVAAVLLAAYVALPIPLRHGPLAADASSVATLRDREQREGRAVTFDRVAYVVRDIGHYLRTYVGEELPLTSARLSRSTVASARAVFVNDSTVAIQEIRDHRAWPRDVLNYVGLALVATTWLVPLVAPRRPGR